MQLVLQIQEMGVDQVHPMEMVDLLEMAKMEDLE